MPTSNEPDLQDLLARRVAQGAYVARSRYARFSVPVLNSGQLDSERDL